MGHRRRSEAGQSLTEFAIITPLLAVLLLGVADFARLYNTMISVETAAREAADYGAFYKWNWCTTGSPDPPCSTGMETLRDDTVAEMEHRACVATSHLPEYAGPDDSCSNPTFSYVLDTTDAGVAESDCPGRAKEQVPCNVAVTLTYTFDLIIPTSLLALPQSFTFQRSATFAVANFEQHDTQP